MNILRCTITQTSYVPNSQTQRWRRKPISDGQHNPTISMHNLSHHYSIYKPIANVTYKNLKQQCVPQQTSFYSRSHSKKNNLAQPSLRVIGDHLPVKKEMKNKRTKEVDNKARNRHREGIEKSYKRHGVTGPPYAREEPTSDPLCRSGVRCGCKK